MNTKIYEKDIEELLGAMRGIVLSECVRVTMRNNLETYAGFHSTRMSDEKRSTQRMTRSFLSHLSPAITRLAKRKYVTALVLPLLVLALMGGTSYAAESALPGNALYPIKVALNERVVGVFSLSEEAKTHWQTTLALRRINEAERLAAQDSLDAGTEVILSVQVAHNVADAVARTKTLDADGKSDTAADIRTNIETSLRTHADILTAIDADSHKNQKKQGHEEQGTSTLRTFITALHLQSESVAHAQEEARRNTNLEHGTTDTKDKNKYVSTTSDTASENHEAEQKDDGKTTVHSDTDLKATIKEDAGTGL